MAEYFLSDMDRRRFELRARWSGLSEDLRAGYFRLFNKNAATTLHVKIIGQEPHRLVWVVACDDVPPYFQHVLMPVNGGPVG